MPPLYTLLILFFLVPTSLFAADISDVGTYARYQENVKQFCDSPNGNLWKDWKKSALLKNTNPPFAEITDPKIDDTYKSYLTKIQADAEEIHRINIAGADIATQVDKAAYLYKSNMNALYACAVMNAKVRISEDIVKMIPTANSNIQERLKSTTEALKLRMQAQWCNTLSEKKGELSLRKTLLDNTMYQYCHYRYYLSYLHHNAVNNYGAFKGAQATASSNTQDALRYIGKTGERIEREIAHAREVYPQALVAYGEFERTYGSHVVLTFIHNDYIEIRNGLKKLMNPIGQVVYKAFYAQGKK